MPHSPSAKKRLKQADARRLRNKARSTRIKSAERRLEQALERNDRAAASEALRQAFQALDKAARHRVIHPNTAANRKSRLSRLLGAGA